MYIYILLIFNYLSHRNTYSHKYSSPYTTQEHPCCTSHYIAPFYENSTIPSISYLYLFLIALYDWIYPTIKTLCVNDGGGSAQIYTQNMSVLPPTDIENFLGRKVPTAIGFKVRKGDI